MAYRSKPGEILAVYFDVKRHSLPPNHRPPTMLGKSIPWQKSTKYLGVTLDQRLSFEPHVKRVTRNARFYLYRLNSMLGRHSKMSLRNKRTLYKVCIRPVMTYASVVFAHANPKTLYKLQVVQNLFCRRAANAPYYVRNADLHRDFDLPTIQQWNSKASERFFKTAGDHPNPLILSAADYDPPTSSDPTSRRPKSVLTDPPDKLSSDLNLLLEATEDDSAPINPDPSGHPPPALADRSPSGSQLN